MAEIMFGDARMPPRFWQKCLIRNGCWEWQAYRNPLGYGHYRLPKRTVLAHRVAYEALVGPVAIGIHCDHLCRNPRCVNPNHLEPVSNRENTVRGLAPTVNRLRQNAIRVCKSGHPFDAENTRIRRDGRRVCKTCNRLNGTAWARKNRG